MNASNIFIKRISICLATSAALFTTSQASAALSVAQSPLFISTSLTPNVMLLIDNSGSMKNIIWDTAYDPAVIYEDWSAGSSSGWGNNGSWDSTNGNVKISELKQSDCASGFLQGNKTDGAAKCLALPDPVTGGNTYYHGNYLNFLYATYVDGDDLTSGPIPIETRQQVAKQVAKQVVNENSSLRFGISTFGSSGSGGSILANCGATTTDLINAIDGLTADNYTPLAEAFYETTRYFRGLDSYTSPIQYRCQKNFEVVITDGYPTKDTTFPTDDPADVADTTASLPDWDGLSPATLQADFPVTPIFSDGWQDDPDKTGTESNEGYSLYLDDLAKFAFDIDFITSGNDNAGISYQDTAFPKQNLITHTVGLATNNQMMKDAAGYSGGSAFAAKDSAGLSAALNDVISSIKITTSAAASVATNSTRLSTDTFIYQARFNSESWDGSLLAFSVATDGSVNTSSPTWNAATLLPAHGSRNIISYHSNTNTGIAFNWASLSTAQKTALNTNPATGSTDTLGQGRLNFIRGDQSKENNPFRERSSRLGDIINSDPEFVGNPDYRFDRIVGTLDPLSTDPDQIEANAYVTFRDKVDVGMTETNTYWLRKKMLYVGANDGMLHGFNAETGQEIFSYVPGPVYDNLSKLTNPAYSHQYYVDGSPRTSDAYIDYVGNSPSWKTVLVGGLGAGGRGIYALDITNPDAFGASKVMWEFTNANDGDLGFTFGQPNIVRMHDGEWYAIIPNGYNSDNHKAVLFLKRLDGTTTGGSLIKLDTLKGTSTDENGMSSAIPVDIDNDRITDYIYAGDLHGNLWKIDVTDTNKSKWKFAFAAGGKPAPLFSACSNNDKTCTIANRQPITVRPEVGLSVASNPVVYFGTGQYFETTDNSTSINTQSFYAIIDKGAVVSRADLQQQSITDEISAFGFDLRAVTNNTVNEDTQSGWYLNMYTAGERVISRALLRAGRVIFTTLIPNTDPCGFGGESWLMELDALNGSRLPTTPFDLNNDGKFSSADLITADDGSGADIEQSAAGKKSKHGIIKTPGVISAGEKEYKYASGTSGEIEVTVESGGKKNGRQSWRQLY